MQNAHNAYVYDMQKYIKYSNLDGEINFYLVFKFL